MYSFNELSESKKLTAEEKKTAKQILGLLNGQNQVAAKQMLDFCSYVIECNSNVAVVFEKAEQLVKAIKSSLAAVEPRRALCWRLCREHVARITPAHTVEDLANHFAAAFFAAEALCKLYRWPVGPFR